MQLTVVSLDPGKTTGYCIGYLKPGELLKLSPGQSPYTHKDLFHMLEYRSPDWIVCESFEYRRGQRDNLVLVSLELIGVADLYAQTHLNVHFVRQNAAQGKSYYSDQKLKSMGLYTKALTHGNDALRHLLHWFTFGAGYQFNTEEVKYELHL